MLQLHGKEIPHNASFHVSLDRYYSKLLADSIYFRNGRLHKTIKFSPYSNCRVPELIPVLGSQPTGDVSLKPDGRLPSLSVRPAVTRTTLKRAATNFPA